MPIRVRVEQNDFGKLASDITPNLALAVEETAQDIRTDAASRSPSHLGIKGKWSVDHRFGARKGGLLVTVLNREWRAVFYEDGAPHTAAQPMLRPALEAARRKFLARLAKAFEHG